MSHNKVDLSDLNAYLSNVMSTSQMLSSFTRKDLYLSTDNEFRGKMSSICKASDIRKLHSINKAK